MFGNIWVECKRIWMCPRKRHSSKQLAICWSICVPFEINFAMLFWKVYSTFFEPETKQRLCRWTALPPPWEAAPPLLLVAPLALAPAALALLALPQAAAPRRRCKGRSRGRKQRGRVRHRWLRLAADIETCKGSWLNGLMSTPDETKPWFIN